MGFSPSGSGSSSINGSTDIVVNGLANGQVISYDQSLSKWKNATLTSSSSSVGTVYFDTFFSGSDDNARMIALNAWAQAQSGPTEAVIFDARQYNFNVPIKLFSGLKLLGGTMSPVREYSRGTVFNWQGGSGSSMFIFPPEGQTGQSYPADGSPRDITVSYIQMQGGASTHCMPKITPTGSNYVGQTLWYCQFHACGFKSFNTVWWGYGTGCSISGQTHFQGIGDTALNLGGSENSIFGKDAYSFSASNVDTGVPFMRTTMAKSYIGMCMITGRKVSTGLSIEGGFNLVVDSLAIDAQSSDPIYGAGIIISGGEAITISNCSFKGVATTPASGYNGAASNRAWIQIQGGNQITIEGTNFRREGNNMPATSYPLVFAAASLPANSVRWGFNGYSNFSTDTIQLQQASSGKIFALDDPRIAIITAA
jgi:hypothetical protein